MTRLRQTTSDFDYALVGGGLQNALVALAVVARRPESRIALVERDSAIGGNHTWCFHAGDVEAATARVIAPAVVQRWAGYDVAFPGFEREIPETYAAITSERLASVVQAALARTAGSVVLLNTAVAEVAADRVTLSGGNVLKARLVIDARGPTAGSAPACAFQKFLGLELELAAPSRRTRPMLMDARVPQCDGFRFFYVLPLASTRVLLEETFFSDGPVLDRAQSRASLLAYAAAAGFDVSEIRREESGVLPLPFRAIRPSTSPPLEGGYRGGWFHPATGYSIPAAARLAAYVAARPPEDVFGAALDELATAHERQARYATFLNRLLFRACAPADRIHVFKRFHRLPQATIRRFYALTTTPADRVRILAGRPPRGVSLRAALAEGVFA